MESAFGHGLVTIGMASAGLEWGLGVNVLGHAEAVSTGPPNMTHAEAGSACMSRD